MGARAVGRSLASFSQVAEGGSDPRCRSDGTLGPLLGLAPASVLLPTSLLVPVLPPTSLLVPVSLPSSVVALVGSSTWWRSRRLER